MKIVLKERDLNYSIKEALPAILQFIETRQKLCTNDIDVLIKCLRKDGPLMISGLLGRSFYDTTAVTLSEKIDGKTIYGWKGSKLKTEVIEQRQATHVVILVGAAISNGKGYVYFLDPNDQSKHDNVPMYKMSYDSLRERVVPGIEPFQGKKFYAYSGVWKDFKLIEIKPV